MIHFSLMSIADNLIVRLEQAAWKFVNNLFFRSPINEPV